MISEPEPVHLSPSVTRNMVAYILSLVFPETYIPVLPQERVYSA